MKTTFALYFGNRGFFPGELVADARKDMISALEKNGYGYDCLTGELFYSPSVDVPREYIKGKTGAGDAYCSGILYAAHEDKTLPEALNIARCCSTASLSENNGTDGMRPFEEIMKLEKEFPEMA